MTHTSTAASTQPGAGRAAPVLCPYCGVTTPAGVRCSNCRGLLDPLSRQATQNAMGPWFVRDANNPYRPGCSHQVLKDMAAKGRLHPDTVLRGPTTRQFWSLAKRTPGVSHLVGLCYACQEEVEPTDEICRFCGVSFEVETDRQHLGLAPVHLLPGQAAPEAIAEASGGPLGRDPLAATMGKVPGTENAAIDDRAERLVHRLSVKLRRQRLGFAAIFLIAAAALSTLAILVAEAHLDIPKNLTRLILTPLQRPAPSTPGSGPAPAAQVPTRALGGDAAGGPDSAGSAGEVSAPVPQEPTGAASPGGIETKPQTQAGLDQELARLRELIAGGGEAGVRQAMAELQTLAQQHPDRRAECEALTAAAQRRLDQLRLRKLP